MSQLGSQTAKKSLTFSSNIHENFSSESRMSQISVRKLIFSYLSVLKRPPSATQVTVFLFC